MKIRIKEVSKNPKMIIMAGGAGSGKTTFVKGNEKKAIDGLVHSIPELKNFEYLNPDTYIEDKDSPMYNSLTKASQQIDDVDVPKNIEAKNNFIWDTTASNAAKMVGGEYKRKQTPGILNTPDYDKMMIMVYAHPIVSFLENFKRERKVPKIGILSTWNNVYGNIEAFEKKLGDNFIMYEAPTNQFYQKEIDQFNEAVRQGKLYEFLENIVAENPEQFISTFKKSDEPLSPEEKQKRKLAAEKSRELYKGYVNKLEQEFLAIDEKIKNSAKTREEIIQKIKTFIK
jgi:hypothetical protein